MPDSVEVHINGIAAGTATFDAEWNRSIFEFDTRANDENIVIEFGVSSAHNSMPRGALVREIVVDGNRWGEERAARRPIDSLSPELLVRSMLLFLRQTSGETLDSKSLVSVAELAEIAREDDFEGSQFRSAWNRLNRELETAGHEALPVPMNDGMGHLVRPSPLHALDEINWGEKRGPESR